jgi:hypothetical protein
MLTMLGGLALAGCGGGSRLLPDLYAQSDWERMGLHGNVRSLTLYELSWEEAFGSISITAPPSVDQSTAFLPTGNQVESQYFDMAGRPDYRDVFVYDSDGETWLECVSYKSPSGSTASPRWSYTNSYDDRNRIARVEGHGYDASGQKSAKASWVHIYEYRADEGKIVRSSYDGDGALQWKNVTEYDAQARASASTHYDQNGAAQWSDRFKYDDKGNRTEWSRYDAKGSLQWRDVFAYDDNGNEVRCSNYDYRGGLMWETVYLYLSEGDLATFSLSGWADIGNKFDGRGNWTVRMTLEKKNGFGGNYVTVKEIQKRALVYFP